MPVLIGFLVTLYLLSLPLLLIAGSHQIKAGTVDRPYGWPWLLPFWPILIGIEVGFHVYRCYRDERRVRRGLSNEARKRWR